MKTLIDFPHVCEQLALRWKDPDAIESYLTSIMINDRDKREGFPPAVFKQLHQILEIHQLLHTRSEMWQCFLASLLDGCYSSVIPDLSSEFQ